MLFLNARHLSRPVSVSHISRFSLGQCQTHIWHFFSNTEMTFSIQIQMRPWMMMSVMFYHTEHLFVLKHTFILHFRLAFTLHLSLWNTLLSESTCIAFKVHIVSLLAFSGNRTRDLAVCTLSTDHSLSVLIDEKTPFQKSYLLVITKDIFKLSAFFL